MEVKSLFALSLLLVVMMFGVTLYPFDFFAKNGVKWLGDSPGVYFDGSGIVHSGRDVNFTKKELTIEILIRERQSSRNWGIKDICTLFNSYALPIISLAQRNNKLIVYDYFEKGEREKWHKQLVIKAPQKGSPFLVTVVVSQNKKSIYLNGILQGDQLSEFSDMEEYTQPTSLALGNSLDFKSGWMGEVKGVALFNRLLSSKEIHQHRRFFFDDGMSKLLNVAGCIALFPMKEREGRLMENLVDPSKPLLLPEYLHSLLSVGSYLPNRHISNKKNTNKIFQDFIGNIIFFLPFGVVLTLMFARNTNMSHLLIIVIVTLSGILLSFLIESLQLLLISRTTDILDILSNTLGGAVGSFAALNVARAYK